MLEPGKTYWVKTVTGWALIEVIKHKPDGYEVLYPEAPRKTPSTLYKQHILESQEQLDLLKEFV